MKNNEQFNDSNQRRDAAQDLLSHSNRKDRIHIFTLDNVLAADVYERIHYDPRMKSYQLAKPQNQEIKQAVAEIDKMTLDTVSSRLLIIDVRRDTLPMLQRAYNKIAGYNRRDLNKLCYTILIGDGPLNLFQAGKSLDVFVSHISSHRIDYHPAVFFYDPFIHYEPDEIPQTTIEDEFILPDKLPKRLAPYFEGQDIKNDMVRRFFRATRRDENTRKERLKILTDLYEKRMEQQFPHHKEQLKAWLSKEGITLASENLHLYPLFFEDWVYELMQKAAQK